MKVMVTGGAGFLGSAFVRLAAGKGIEVVVVDKLTYAGDLKAINEFISEKAFYKVDITQPESLEDIFKREKPQIVIHFAAESHVDRSIINPGECVISNVVGTGNLLNIAVKYDIERFVQVSTDEVYGQLSSNNGAEFKETDRLLPSSPYAATKASGDLLVMAFRHTYGLPAMIVRPSNAYGPWQYPDKLIPLAVARIFLGEKIPVYGKGENLRTWLFIDDCAEGILQVMQRGEAGEIYNISGSEERKNIDVVKSVLYLLGKDDGMIEFIADRPGHDFRYAVDTSKLKALTGWTPMRNFDQGLEETTAWYKNNREWLLAKKNEVDAFVRMIRTRYESMRS